MKLNEYIEDISFHIKYHWKEIKYWFLYRFNPKYYRYWMVKPSTLSINYHDADTLLVHSSFQVISDFYEDVMFYGSTDWGYCENHRNVIKLIKEVYVWWNIDRIKLEKQIESLYDSNDYDKITELENYLFDKDTTMLCEIIKHRAYLWD